MQPKYSASAYSIKSFLFDNLIKAFSFYYHKRYSHPATATFCWKNIKIVKYTHAKFLLAIVTVGLSPSMIFAQSVVPDFNDELGISSDRVLPNFSGIDHIDPFTGKLTVTHDDIEIPGPGGLNIKISRVYNSLPNMLFTGLNSNLGMGWSFHLGRIAVPAGALDLCDGGNFSNSGDNAVFETADGRRQVCSGIVNLAT